MEKPDQVEFFFDLGSPWTYVASTQLDGLCERTGVEIRWRPFLLGGVFKATNNKSPFLEPVWNKLNHQREDMKAWIAHYGIPFNFPSNFPPNTLLAMRGAVVADTFGRIVPYARAANRAFFVNDEDLSDPETVMKIAERAGLDRGDFEKRLAATEVKEALRRNTDEAVERGAFGSPTFFWNGHMFFGNDRLALLEAFIHRAK